MSRAPAVYVGENDRELMSYLTLQKDGQIKVWAGFTTKLWHT